MVQTKTFSAFATADLTNSGNLLVGIGGGINIKAAKVTTWTTGTRPSPPFDGLIGYNSTLKQWEYWNSATSAWIQLANNAIVNATYILQTANALLPNAQALGSLSTGILKSTATTGVVSISAPLTSIDGLTTIANQMIYTTASNTYATTPLTAFARTLLDDSTAAAMRTTLGLGTAATKNATDNAQSNVASTIGSFTVGHLLVAADTSGTATDGGTPFGGGTVTSITVGTGLTATPDPITTTGTISLDVPVVLANGGTNANLTANNGGIVYSTAASLAILAGTATANLPLLSGSSSAPGWGSFALSLGGALTTAGALTTSGAFGVTFTFTNTTSVTFPTSGTLATTSQLPTLPLSPTDGGTGVSNPTAHGIMVAEGASNMTPIVLGAGQILIGTTASDPAAGAIGSGSGILVGNGSGSISVSLAAIADHTLLANISGGALAPSSTTLTALIDNAIGSTQGDLLYRNGTVWTVLAPGSAGQLLKTGGVAANPAWTTATFPATGGAAGNILISDGTNYIASTSLWPNTVGNSGKIVRSNGTSNTYSTATYPDVATGTGTMLRADGTNWVASTSTFADTYGASTLLYSNGANTVVGLATASNGLLTTDGSSVPSITALSGLGILASLVKTVKVQTFTTPGANTYTPSTGMLYCTIEVQAPGGGGGGVVTSIALQTTISGGGGGGGYARKTVTAATIGASQTVTIGSVGTAGANTGTNGGTGGTTSVGAIVSATGGVGGSGLNASGLGANSVGGVGGVGSSGDININGGGGFNGMTSPTSGTNIPNQNPSGGDSYFSGINAYQAGFGAGVDGMNYGSGGTGAFSFGAGGGAGAFAGGTGGPAIVVITEYCNQ